MQLRLICSNMSVTFDQFSPVSVDARAQYVAHLNYRKNRKTAEASSVALSWAADEPDVMTQHQQKQQQHGGLYVKESINGQRCADIHVL